MTVREAIAEASATLRAAAVSEPERDAGTLLLHLLGRDRAWLLAHPGDSVQQATLQQFQDLVQRRAAREPLQYLTGQQEFYGLPLTVTPAVLIPRPETELLVEAVMLWAAEHGAGNTLQIADVGTGSGAIALALSTHLGGVHLLALDLHPAALAVAQGNALRLGITDVRFQQRDLLEGLTASSLDIVVSNPPYVPATDAPTMQPEVVQHEPHSALFAGLDGLNLYRRLIPQAHAALRPGGLLAMEFGFGQRDALAALLAGWHHIRFIDDLAGIPRHVLAEKP